MITMYEPTPVPDIPPFKNGCMMIVLLVAATIAICIAVRLTH